MIIIITLSGVGGDQIPNPFRRQGLPLPVDFYAIEIRTFFWRISWKKAWHFPYQFLRGGILSTGLRSPGGGRKANNTGQQTSSLTRAVTPPKELLGDMAIDAWKRTNRLMIDRGTFEMEDCYLLMEYCNTVQLLYDANIEIKDGGVGDETAAGGQKMGAAVKARDRYITQLIRLSVILKLNPGGRITVAKPGSGGAAAGNEFEEF